MANGFLKRKIVWLNMICVGLIAVTAGVYFINAKYFADSGGNYEVVTEGQPVASWVKQTDFSGGATSSIHTANWSGDGWTQYESVSNITWTGPSKFKLTDPSTSAEIVFNTATTNDGSSIAGFAFNFNPVQTSSYYFQNYYVGKSYRTGATLNSMSDWESDYEFSPVCYQNKRFVQYKITIGAEEAAVLGSAEVTGVNLITGKFDTVSLSGVVRETQPDPNYDYYAGIEKAKVNIAGLEIIGGDGQHDGPGDLSGHVLSLSTLTSGAQFQVSADGYQSKTVPVNDSCFAYGSYNLIVGLDKNGTTNPGTTEGNTNSTTNNTKNGTKQKTTSSSVPGTTTPPVAQGNITLTGIQVGKNKDKLTSIDAADYPIISPNETLVLSGITTPSTKVVVTIKSDPTDFETTSDATGAWRIEIVPLSKKIDIGEHIIYAHTVDKNNVAGTEIQLSRLNIVAEAATTSTTQLRTPTNTKPRSFLYWSIGIIVLIMIAGTIILVRRRKKRPSSKSVDPILPGKDSSISITDSSIIDDNITVDSNSTNNDSSSSDSSSANNDTLSR